MHETEVPLKSAGPMGTSNLYETIVVREHFFAAQWWGKDFMLPQPEPAAEVDDDVVADIEAARAALAESAERIPYDRVRRQLGFE